ncbi:MAG: serine hydrolase [Planctomycetota bacterium]
MQASILSTARRAATLALCIVAPAAVATAQIVAYHGVSEASHIAQHDSLKPQGYRLLSLSIAGTLSAHHYTAVWIRRPGPAFSVVHGCSETQFNTSTALMRVNGYRPQLVTAAGAGTATVFSGVFVQDGVGTRHLNNIDRATLDTECNDAVSQGRKLTCLAIHGLSTAPRYSVVFEANPDGTVWGYSVGDDLATFTQRAAAMVSAHGRPVFVTLSNFFEYGGIWMDDQAGPWEQRFDMTSAQYQTEFTQRLAQGYYPLVAHAGNVGSSTRWSAVFVQRETVDPRIETTTGAILASRVPTGLPAFDDHMWARMRATKARASALAIAKDGRLIMARGYTFAENGHPIVQPTTMFRLASCSKPLVALAAQRLSDMNSSYGMTSNASQVLGLTGNDPNFNTIRIEDLIQHTSGILRDTNVLAVMNWLSPTNPTLPVSSWNTTRYIATQPLNWPPRTVSSYTNEGYTVLGSTVERASGKTLERFLREDVGAPLGVTRLWVGRNQWPMYQGETSYRLDRLATGGSNIHTDRRLLAKQYGGGFDLNRTTAPGGLITSAVDYVRLLSGAYVLGWDELLLRRATSEAAMAAPTGINTVDHGGFAWEQRQNGVIAHGKGGTMNGTRTEVIVRSDGVAIAAFFAKSGADPQRSRLQDLADAVTSWPTGDLFPQYGLASFQRRNPRLFSVSPAILPNVGDQPFTLRGEVMDAVTHVTFGRQTITGRDASSWRDGWFRIVDESTLEVYPPQGQAPTAYAVRAFNGARGSDTVSVQLNAPQTHVLGAPPTVSSAFDLIATLGTSDPSAVALLALSDSNAPSSLPGYVDFDIGAGFTRLWTWPVLVGFDPVCACARWNVPQLRPGARLYFQAAIADGRSARLLPLPLTDVRAVLGR